MFIDRYVWIVGDLSEEELKIAQRGPRDKNYTAVIAFMVVFGLLGVMGRTLMPEVGVTPIVIWTGCAIVLGCYTALDIRQGRRYSRLMNGRTVHQIKTNDPFDRLTWAVDDDRDLLDRHSGAADNLFERTSAWEAWENLCKDPGLPEEEERRLNHLINREAQDVARMMQELEPAAAR